MSVVTDSPSTFVHRKTIKPRFSRVFVEIPRLPFASLSPQTSTKSLKENAPLASTTSFKMLPAKRKVEDSPVHPSKKSKISDKASVNSVKVDAPCHHCRKRKPLTDILQCTRVTQHGSRCKASYCDICLQNKLQFDVLKKPFVGSKQGHIIGDYIFSCPRCDDCCTCAPCRKKGIVDISQRSVTESTPHVPFQNTTNDGIALNVQIGRAMTVSKPRHKKAPAEPSWVPFLPGRRKKEIEDRLYIREFILRFNPILNIGIKNLEELDDPSTLHDSSTKAILLALLDIIALEAEANVKEIQTKLKSIQGLGFNWSRIVPMVEDLRNLVPKGHPFYSLPIMEKEKNSSYSVRSGLYHGIHADNLLPLLLHMIGVVCEGGSVREELEVGNEQSRKARSEHYMASRKESDRWNEEKQILTNVKPNIQNKEELGAHKWTAQYKEAETRHKKNVADLRNYFRLETNSCTSRFEPLGVDPDGRIYYSPSSIGPYRGKKDRLPTANERLGFRKWGWFIVVYGKPGTQIQNLETENPDTTEKPETIARSREGWWGFSDVSELRKLSNWLTNHFEEKIAGATTEEGAQPKAPLNPTKQLAKAINEFADFIDWRLKRSTSK